MGKMTESDARPVGETAEAVKLAEPFAPRTYRSAWIHDRLVTAEEWLAAEAEVDETMDRADPDDDGLFRGGDLRAIAREITELRRAAKTWADECTRRAALLAGAPTVWVATDDRGDSWCCTAATPAEADGKGEWLPLEGPLTQPGTVRRYALVPIEEEGT
jgi:hypothetical protein